MRDPNESDLESLRRLWRHACWANDRLVEALGGDGPVPKEAIREHAHLIGTEEVWLSRLEVRSPRCSVWPDVGPVGLEELLFEVRQAYGRYFDALDPSDLDSLVTYTNSAGATFTNRVGDILLHVFLHGQYHRGKVNLLLRQAGAEPAPVDYIAWVRGAPAATEADAER